MPFLNMARDSSKKQLGEELGCVESVAYDFWPDLGGEPDVLLTLTRKEMPPALILVEAKLDSGKSQPTGTGPVKDQLGRYWVGLQELAGNKAAAVAIVYVTSHLRYDIPGRPCPRRDFDETQEELTRNGVPPAPLYWLSWCHFENAVRHANKRSMPSILDDLCRVLMERYGLAQAMAQWPQPSAEFPAWTFHCPFDLPK